MCCMISRRPPNAPTGMPPPTILPSVVRSGLMPYSCLRAAARHAKAGHHFVEDQHGAVLRAYLAQRFEEPGTGGMQFMLPATGSTITQAICAPTRGKQLAAPVRSSLYDSVSVWAASSAGTPGDVGTPSVSAPEPALTSSESEWP